MIGVAPTIAIFGALLLLGLVADSLSSRLRLPRVTLLLLLGLVAGPSVLNLLPPEHEAWFTVSANVALVMIGFLLGGEFTYNRGEKRARGVLPISIFESTVTAVMVAGGLLLTGTPPAVALSLAGVGAATDPAATLAVVRETGAKGRFPDLLKGVVAVDDIVGIVLFSLMVTLAGFVSGSGIRPDALLQALREIGGAAGLGLVLGLPAAALTGRVRPGEATLEEALGIVLLCTGLSLWLNVSPILASMTLGATVANLARHHERPFHEIENIEWPFLVIFFILAGASLQLSALGSIGGVAAAYIGLRALGKAIGPVFGQKWLVARRRAPRVFGWFGLALMPQGGVAIGLSLAAAMRFPEAGRVVLGVAVVGTVIFELVGPVCTRQALLRTPDEEAAAPSLP